MRRAFGWINRIVQKLIQIEFSACRLCGLIERIESFVTRTLTNAQPNLVQPFVQRRLVERFTFAHAHFFSSLRCV